MNLMKLLVPVAGVLLVVGAWRTYGWAGVALAAGALVMWALLHFSRMLKVLQRAAQRPMGYCDSAVMLNAKLRPGVNLMHVIAMTRAVGQALTEPDVQPEIFRWTDSTDSHVTCEFKNGKLVKWELFRPEQAGQ